MNKNLCSYGNDGQIAMRLIELFFGMKKNYKHNVYDQKYRGDHG